MSTRTVIAESKHALFTFSAPISMVLIGLCGCAKADTVEERQTAKSPTTAAERATNGCPATAVAGDWVTVETSDGRLRFRVPPSYRPIPAQSAQIWGDGDQSIGYTSGPTTADDTAQSRMPGVCSEQLGSIGKGNYYFADAATGKGQYLQAYFVLASGQTLRLTGFAEDTAGAPNLLAIARSVELLRR